MGSYVMGREGYSALIIIFPSLFLQCITNQFTPVYFSNGQIYVGEYQYDKENGIGVLRCFSHFADALKPNVNVYVIVDMLMLIHIFASCKMRLILSNYSLLAG